MPCIPLTPLGSISPAVLVVEMELMWLHMVLSCCIRVGGPWRVAVWMQGEGWWGNGREKEGRKWMFSAVNTANSILNIFAPVPSSTLVL